MSTRSARRHLFRSSTAAVAVSLALIAVGRGTDTNVAAQAGGRALFGAAPPGRPMADAHRSARPAPKRSRLATIRADLLALDGNGAAPIALNLFDDVRLVARVDRVERRSSGSFVWHGRVDGVRHGHAIFASNDGVLAGVVSIEGATFGISYAGDGLYDVRQVDPSAFPTDDPIGDLVPATPMSGTIAPPATDSAAEQDLLVLWTPAARVEAGGTPAIQSLIDVAVGRANTAYANSGVITRLRLVYRGEITYVETGISTDLTALSSNGDGKLDGVHALRDQFGADVVSLIGAGYTADGACGIGYLMNSPGSSFAPSAFSVVDWSCANENLTLAHEIGHNQGLNHDPANAAGQGAYPYSFGYVDPSCVFRTVMSYGACERVMQFSSPGVTFNGRVTGTPSQDNARTLNNTALIIANFRQQVGGSCTYTLSRDSINVPASGQTATLTVSTSAGCDWTATSNAGWITVVSGATGNGSGTVMFSVASNGGPARNGSATVAGQVVNITQLAAACSFSLSAPTATVPATGGTGTVAVSAAGGCDWSASSSAPWLVVTSGGTGTGSGVVAFAAAPNVTALTRSATITIASRTLTVTQPPGGAGAQVFLDRPDNGASVRQPFTMSGWAIDAVSAQGTGIDAVHLYAYPNGGSGTPLFIGVGELGGSRADVAAFLGDSRFERCGFTGSVSGLAPDTYLLVAFARSTVTGAWNASARIVTVQATPQLVIEGPAAGSLAGQPFYVSGWAYDPSAATGTGVDSIVVYVEPAGGGARVRLGEASRSYRPELAARLGPRFGMAGYYLGVYSLPPGQQRIIVEARSTVTGQIEASQSRVIETGPLTIVDTPGGGAPLPSLFSVEGWSIDQRSTADGGIDAMHIYAYPLTGGDPIFLGAAQTWLPRPDVGAFYGAQFGNSGYQLDPAVPLAPGPYLLVLFPHSSVSNTFATPTSLVVTVGP